jgi:sulfide:quinone oxidoreductase
MSRIVVLGAGLGGAVAAYEARHEAREEDEVIVVNETPWYSFVPSNPWVLVGWRQRKGIEVDLRKPFKRRGIDFVVGKAAKVDPIAKAVAMEDGSSVPYDYLIIATGPELAFDEIEGLGPHGGHTQSVCHIDHAEKGYQAFEAFCQKPGPIIVGAVQGASCFGPAYETAMILDTELRKRKIRDKVPMTFVTSEPYIGHLGLDGVGDTKGLLESEMRERHIKWITNAKVTKVEADVMHVDEYAEDGTVKASHDLPMAFSMMLPAFRGVGAVQGVDKLANPRGFILADKHQRHPNFPDIFSIGVCVAIPPPYKSVVPVGVPKTGFMIESMVTAATKNIGQLLRGQEPSHEGTWNALCLADFGDGGVVFLAQPQLPPRNVNWSASGGWVHLAKIAFEKYFLRKLRIGDTEPYYERMVMNMIGARKVKA